MTCIARLLATSNASFMIKSSHIVSKVYFKNDGSLVIKKMLGSKNHVMVNETLLRLTFLAYESSGVQTYFQVC